MRVIASLDAFRPDRCALAMGKFDGVHRGHQSVLTETVRIAREQGIPSVALTFDRNPLAVIDPDHAPETLTPLGKKRALVEAMGVDILIVCPFTRALMDMEPEDFLRMLRDKLRPAAIVCGENNTFGRAARGNAALLRRMADELDYRAVVIPLCEVDGEVASSSRVRRLMDEGRRDEAMRVLGREEP